MSKIVANTYIYALKNAAGKLGWTVTKYEDHIELEKKSPAGRSILITVPNEKSARDVVIRHYITFKESDYVDKVLKENGQSDAPDKDEIMKDARAVSKMLRNLKSAVSSIELYTIPVVWQEMGYLECYGTSQQNAAEIALDYDSNSESGDGLPLPDDGNYLDDSFEVDFDGIEKDPPAMTELQQHVYDDCAKYGNGCSYEEAIRIADENVPHFFLEKTDFGDDNIVCMYYDENESESEFPIICRKVIDRREWLYHYNTLSKYLNERNFCTFFSEMNELSEKNPFSTSAPLYYFSETEEVKEYWAHTDMCGYTLETLRAIATAAKNVKD